jgi:hypothetical protein
MTEVQIRTLKGGTIALSNDILTLCTLNSTAASACRMKPVSTRRGRFGMR